MGNCLEGDVSAWEKEGKTLSSKGNGWWKRICDKLDARALVPTERQKRKALADKLCAEFNVGREHHVSLKTVIRDLHRVRYYNPVAMCKQLITLGNALLPDEWCKKHRQWTAMQWRKVI